MKRSFGAYITHVAVALYLLACGILGLTEQTLWQRLRLAVGSRNATGNEIVDTLTQVFGTGDLTKTLVVLFSILAVAGAAFLFLELFGLRIPAVDIIILVFLAVWMAFMVLSDGVYAFRNTRNFDFLPWLKTLATHLVVLGALISASRRFGD
ncbi:MAG: hypothetical protein LBI94_00220 [Treponema sp.]|jgi:hypothetical protein|nr:hypothetical protein [Treponema sp.]